MSKNPLEELFGPASSEPQPVPARERLAHEQAERVRTAQLSAAPRERRGEKSGGSGGSGAGDDDRVAKAKPWIVVGLVAVVALIASMVIVNLARGSGEPGPTAEPQAQKTTTSAPASPDPTPTKPPASEKPKDQVPQVEVGPTNRLDIPTWGITAQLSGKFGMTSYNIPDNVNLQLDSPLINSLPESCAAMRTEWGVTKRDAGSYVVRKPTERCAAAPELYDELWGLTDALVKSIKPA